MTKRIDFGKPGDPSGCYMPREWWRPAPPAAKDTTEQPDLTRDDLKSDSLEPTEDGR